MHADRNFDINILDISCTLYRKILILSIFVLWFRPLNPLVALFSEPGNLLCGSEQNQQGSIRTKQKYVFVKTPTPFKIDVEPKGMYSTAANLRYKSILDNLKLNRIILLQCVSYSRTCCATNNKTFSFFFYKDFISEQFKLRIVADIF